MFRRLLVWLGLIDGAPAPDNGRMPVEEVELEEVPDCEALLAGDPSATDVINIKRDVSTKARYVINRAQECQKRFSKDRVRKPGKRAE
jgi:hypothetical protein